MGIHFNHSPIIIATDLSYDPVVHDVAVSRQLLNSMVHEEIKPETTLPNKTLHRRVTKQTVTS